MRSDEDQTRCIERVWSGSTLMGDHQCSRKRGHGPGGLYCKQHDPEAVKKRKEESGRKWAAEWAAQRQKNRRNTASRYLFEGLKAIADGANDARATAKALVDEWGDAFEGDNP